MYPLYQFQTNAGLLGRILGTISHIHVHKWFKVDILLTFAGHNVNIQVGTLQVVMHERHVNED